MKLIKQDKKPEPSSVLPSLMTTLWEADQAVRKFQVEHETVFTSYQALTEARDVAKNELSTEAKRIGAGYEDERVACEYVMPNSWSWDVDYIRKTVSKDILDSLGVIETTYAVNEKILKMLVRAGKIKKSVMEKAHVGVPTNSPRVTITIKEPENE